MLLAIGVINISTERTRTYAVQGKKEALLGEETLSGDCLSIEFG
jgi:hypothetical protein